MTDNAERILVIAHGHPDFSLGGAEIAAYNLFKAYKNHPRVSEAWFLARMDRGRGNTGQIRMRRQDQYVWEQGVGDWTMRSANREAVHTWFADLIRALRPTVIHAHHYVHLGLDMFAVIKEIDPSIKIYLTLHEYIAICANNGQMIKTDGRLCYQSSEDECQQCFPHRTSEDFWLRNHYFRHHFDLVDGFVSPSDFLSNRYVAWGVPAERIVTIENGQPTASALPPRTLAPGERRNRFAYFGQINRYKGLNVLLDGLLTLPKRSRKAILLEVHGTNLDKQPQEFQDKIATARAQLEKEGVLKWMGPYQPHEMRHRMSRVDWTTVPSIWWENSPMVIQEAFSYRRPPLVSDIGGMAEKVKDGVDGVHVTAGSDIAWGETLDRLANSEGLWEKLVDGIHSPLSYDECAQEHFDFFDALATGR